MELESAVKGKLGEYDMIGELLKRRFEVYLPVVDRGIDCVVKGESGKFYEIQIKTRIKPHKHGGVETTFTFITSDL